jgi:O-antigen/teichoic acid export membrane protein
MSGSGFVQGSAWITGGRLLAVAARFLASLLVARLLGPEGRGQYALLVLIPTLFVQVLHLGMGQAYTFLVGRKDARPGSVAANALLVGGVGGAGVVTALLALWAVWRPAFLPDVPLPLLALSCVAVPFALVHFSTSFALLGQGKTRKYGLLLLIEGGGQLLYLLLFLIILDWGLAGAMLAWSLTTITVTLFSVSWLLRPATPRLRPDRNLLRQALAYGLRIYPAGIMQYLNLRFDQFLVESLAGTNALGLYAVVVSLTEAAWQVPIALSTALFSRVSATSDRQADRVTPRVLRLTLIVTLLEVVALFLLGRPLIRLLFGAEFEAALPALYWLLPGTLLYAMPRVLEGDLAGRGYPSIPSLAVGVAVMVTVVLDLFWIPRWGIVGAARASSLAYAANALILLVAFGQITGLSWRQLWRPQRR